MESAPYFLYKGGLASCPGAWNHVLSAIMPFLYHGDSSRTVHAPASNCKFKRTVQILHHGLHHRKHTVPMPMPMPALNLGIHSGPQSALLSLSCIKRTLQVYNLVWDHAGPTSTSDPTVLSEGEEPGFQSP